MNLFAEVACVGHGEGSRQDTGRKAAIFELLDMLVEGPREEAGDI